MWEPVCEWLLLNYPVIMIVSGIVFFSWKTFSLYNRFTVTEHSIRTHIQDFREIKSKVWSIDEKLNQLIVYLQSTDTRLKGLIQSKSPMELTHLAFRVLKDYGGCEYLEKHMDGLIRLLKEANPQTPLDVQHTAFNIISQQSETPSFKAIKDYLYNKPTLLNSYGDEIQIDLSTLNYIMAITLRNEYLAHNPITKT